MLSFNLPAVGWRRAVAFCLLSFSVGCAGGGGPANVVTGKVSYKGKALTTGTIEFHGPNHVIRSGPINADGSFRVSDVPAGDDTVVVKVPPAPKTPPGVKMPGSDVTPVPVPPKYASPATSGVKRAVPAGEAKIDIDLK